MGIVVVILKLLGHLRGFLGTFWHWKKTQKVLAWVWCTLWNLPNLKKAPVVPLFPLKWWFTWSQLKLSLKSRTGSKDTRSLQINCSTKIRERCRIFSLKNNDNDWWMLLITGDHCLIFLTIFLYWLRGLCDTERSKSPLIWLGKSFKIMGRYLILFGFVKYGWKISGIILLSDVSILCSSANNDDNDNKLASSKLH